MGPRGRVAGAVLVLLISASVAIRASTSAAAGLGTPVDFGVSVAPKRLPAGPGATELKVAVAERSEGIPPGISTVALGLDRSIALEPRGLPPCRMPGIEGGIQIQAAGPDECDRAVVGRVEARVLFDFPESEPTVLSGRGKVYAGPLREGGSNLYLELPLPGMGDETLWLLAEDRPARDGRIGSEMTIDVPTISAGAGRLVDLHLELRRAFRHAGKPVGYVEASCPRGSLVASATVTLGDGSSYPDSTTRSCRPAK